ncbi:methyltransferase-like protein 24, partial [Biomphalaria pfeifferi]
NKSSAPYTSKKLLMFVIVTCIAVSIIYFAMAFQPVKVTQDSNGIAQDAHNEALGSDIGGQVNELRKILCTDKLAPNDILKTSLTYNEMLGGKKDAKKKETIDNSGAAAFLTNYTKMFGHNQMQTPAADPNSALTIRTWWQAAAMIDWYYNGPKRYECKQVKPMGNWHICQDPPYTVSPPCLVYSFGINYDFSFDDAMVSLGCEVHSFDPSMNMETHKRKNGNFSYFYKWGLSNVNADAYEPRKDVYVKNVQSWKMRTLKSLIKELGHEERTIDVLKMDIEGYEWGVVDNLLETDVLKQVRQFLIEYHLFPSFPAKVEYVYLYQTISRVREMGFREFYYGDEPRNINEANFNNQRVVDYVSFFFQH